MRHSRLKFGEIVEVWRINKALRYALWLVAVFALYPVRLESNDAALVMALVFARVAYAMVGLPWKPSK